MSGRDQLARDLARSERDERRSLRRRERRARETASLRAAERGPSDPGLELAIDRLQQDLRRTALSIAEDDRELADDLYQEALIALWEQDAGRFGPEEMGFLRIVAVHRMIDVGRRDAARRMSLPNSLRL